MKYIKNWKTSLNITERFNWATKEQQKAILAEIKYQREQKDILAEIKYQREQKDIQFKELITKEITIAQKEGQPTSRLTSLFNKIKDSGI